MDVRIKVGDEDKTATSTSGCVVITGCDLTDGQDC